MIHLVKGELLEVFRLNPMAPLLFFVLLNEIRLVLFCKNRKKTDAYILVGTVVLSLIVYVIRMELYFPNQEPYVFYRNCLLFHIIHLLF